jgi:hypothetical protein
MKKTSKSSPKPKQESLIDSPVVIDFLELLTQSALSENEQGILKRRLLENRKLFAKVLQLLLQKAEQAKQTIDIEASLKKLEDDETREIRSFDAMAKILAKEFPELLQFLLAEYQIDAKSSRTLIGKEFIVIKRIADVLFEALDKNGNQVIIHLEFERQYESDVQMDKRKLEYRQLMEMDDELAGKTILCNVFYLRGSPPDKPAIEERQVKLPTHDPRYSGELQYKAYHLSLVTIDMIIEKNLPFLLPFIVKSELQAEALEPKNMLHIAWLRQQIDENEAALTSMIENLTATQLETLRITVEYLWGKSYSEDVFNKSTLLKLMKEQFDLRQSDIQLGLNQAKALAKQLAQEGKMTTALLEEFITRMDELKQTQEKKTYERTT